jgi:hypothetical protein
MAKRMQKLLVALAACAALATGGAVFAQAQSSPPSGSENPSAVDRDNIRSGDQTTPDQPGAAATSAVAQNEPPGSTEQPGTESSEQPGTETAPGSDGPGGHADEPGNAGADHQFDGVE